MNVGRVSQPAAFRAGWETCPTEASAFATRDYDRGEPQKRVRLPLAN